MMAHIEFMIVTTLALFAVAVAIAVVANRMFGIR
jgi:hypothetical protein